MRYIGITQGYAPLARYCFDVNLIFCEVCGAIDPTRTIGNVDIPYIREDREVLVPGDWLLCEVCSNAIVSGDTVRVRNWVISNRTDLTSSQELKEKEVHQALAKFEAMRTAIQNGAVLRSVL